MKNLLNKLVIPAILTATVLIAGIFAFSPVDEAQTVHSSLGGVISINESITDVGDATVFTITCTDTFFIPSMYVDSSGVGAGDTIAVEDVTVDGNIVDEFSGNVQDLDIAFEDFYIELLAEGDLAGGLSAEATVGFGFDDDEDDADDPITVIAIIVTNGSCSAEFT